MTDIRFLAVPAALVALTALAACAQSSAQASASAPEASAKPVTTRVQVLTRADWADAETFSAHAAKLAGVPTRDPSMSSARFFSMTLVCPDTPTCDAAVQRLVEARSDVAEVRPDLRMTIPRPVRPSASAAR